MVFWIAVFPPNWNTSSRWGRDTSFQATGHTLENKIFKFLKVSYPSTLKGVNTLGRVWKGQLWPVRLLREVQLWSCSTASGLHVCNDSPEVCHITHKDTCCVCLLVWGAKAGGLIQVCSVFPYHPAKVDTRALYPRKRQSPAGTHSILSSETGPGEFCLRPLTPPLFSLFLQARRMGFPLLLVLHVTGFSIRSPLCASHLLVKKRFLLLVCVRARTSVWYMYMYVSGPQRACGSQETNSILFWGKFSFVYCWVCQASWPSNF